jgi:hypothetical protein
MRAVFRPSAPPEGAPAFERSLQESGASALAANMATGRAVAQAGNLLLDTANPYSGSNAFGAALPLSLLPDGRAIGYPTTFHPDAITAEQSVPVRLRAGDDVVGIDVVMRPRTLIRLAGRVVAPDGPAAGYAVHLIPMYAAGEWLERTHEAAMAVTGADGAFQFAAVPQGRYVVRSWRRQQVSAIGRDPLPVDPTLWGETTVAISEMPITSLVVRLQAGVTVAGRIEFDGAGDVPVPQRLQPVLSVCFEPTWRLVAAGGRIATRVTGSREFVTHGLPPGRYRPNLPNQFTASLTGWHFESISLNGQDLTIAPLVLDTAPVADVVIRFSDRRTSLHGTVLDASGQADGAAAVVVFPADYENWIVNGLSPTASWQELTSQRGRYSVAVRPGEYLVAAVNGDRVGDWRRPETIRALAPHAVHVALASGESPPLVLRTSQVRGRP